MKTAAILLVLTSTAFATGTRPAAVAPSPESSQVSASTEASAQSQTPVPKKKKPSSTIVDRTPLDPTVSAASPGYGSALAKRRVKKSLAVNLPSDPGIKAPTFGDFTLTAQLRNTMTMAKVSDLQDQGGKNFGLSNEVRLGLKHKSGFGFAVTGTYQTQNYADPASDTGGTGDASLILYHPSLYKDNTFDLYGNLRIYAPTSQASQDKGVHSAAYWSFLDITLPKKFAISQSFSVRGFTQDAPAPTDLSSVVFDCVELSRTMFKGVTFAAGIQGEGDNFHGAPTATEVDLYPFIDFAIIPNVLIEPKYYFPVFVNGGSVNATGAALNQTQAELFIKIAI